MSEIVNRTRVAAVVVFASALLSGCATQGGSSEDRIGSLMVAPGKYEFYTCAHLAGHTAGLKTRERELDALIAKAGPGIGGSFVSSVAYRPEYLKVRSDLNEVRKAEEAKNCPPAAAAAAAPAPPASSKPQKR